MKFRIYILFLGLLAMFLITSPTLSQEPPLKVSLSKNSPLVFTDENGEAKGIYVDIIQYVASQEGWELEFVPCIWQQCQQYLKDGTIDLLMSVAYNEERAQKFDFTSEPVFNNWAYVYRKPGTRIDSIVDLEGKKVAVVRANIHSKGFIETLQSFNIHSEIVEVDDYPDVFRLIDEGQVAAGVVNRLNGLKYEQQFNAEKTSIIFNPIELLFATPKGKHADVRAAIDRHMGELKQNENSPYYQSLEMWLGMYQSPKTVFPVWLKWGMALIAGVTLVLAGFTYTLRFQVKQKTAELQTARDQLEEKVQERTTELDESIKQLKREIEEHKRAEEALRESEAKLLAVTENSPDHIMLLDREANILFINRTVPDLSEEEVIGKSIYELVEPENLAIRKEVLKRVLETGRPDRFETRRKSPNGSTQWFESRVSSVMQSDQRVGLVINSTDITERKRAEEQIKAALEEREVLLREVHHRVKNNMQTLIHLIDMQVEAIKDPAVVHILEDFQGRVHAMGLVHEQLYQAKDLAQINLRTYLEDLTYQLYHALASGRPIALRVVADDVPISVSKALPCGMIVNELMTNALKYAFPPPLSSPPTGGTDHEIRVEFGAQEDEYVLTVGDNGIGMPSDLDWRTTESLGLKLVNIWATYQLQGTLDVNTREGTTFTIKFPK